MNHSQNSKTKRQKDREMVYQLEGRPGLSTAVPLGLQHVLAMFTSNLAPILIIASVCGLSGADTVIMVQCAMFVSGLTTFVQLYPIKLGKNRHQFPQRGARGKRRASAKALLLYFPDAIPPA